MADDLIIQALARLVPSYLFYAGPHILQVRKLGLSEGVGREVRNLLHVQLDLQVERPRSVQIDKSGMCHVYSNFLQV